MKKFFEDEFMDIQIRMISTCLEGLEEIKIKPDIMYIYAFDSSTQSFFNVFFKCNNDTAFYFDLGVSDNIVKQVLNFGIDDVQELTELCIKNKRKAPNQYKLIYDLKTDKLKTDYEYDDLKDAGIDPMEIFLSWKESVFKNIK